MTTNTSNHGWPKPVFPSENVADELDTLFDEMDKTAALRGPESSLPSAGTADRLYFTTDTNKMFYDDGSVWQDITPGGSTYSDSDAVAAVNADSDHGSTAQHDYFSGSHADLSGVGSSDHHVRYSDSEAVSAVNAETSLSVDVSGDADSVDGYDIQKNGTDGSGIINFKT